MVFNIIAKWLYAKVIDKTARGGGGCHRRM